eukprot:Amastigsp_a685383_4.p3 type:complete len:160 gc:universal Amastigsp_a685383_4:707-228(-)
MSRGPSLRARVARGSRSGARRVRTHWNRSFEPGGAAWDSKTRRAGPCGATVCFLKRCLSTLGFRPRLSLRAHGFLRAELRVGRDASGCASPSCSFPSILRTTSRFWRSCVRRCVNHAAARPRGLYRLFALRSGRTTRSSSRCWMRTSRSSPRRAQAHTH